MKITAYLTAYALDLFLKGNKVAIYNYRPNENYVEMEFDREEVNITVENEHIFVQFHKWED